MAVLSGSAYSLGLGGIELGSRLNQPFSAEIEVLTDVPGEADELAVQLASQEAFMRAGIDRPASLNKLSFELKERGGRAFIVVTSNDPIVEPFLNFLVEVDWKRGNLVREYTVLLDPPTFISETPRSTVTSELAEVSDSAVSDPSLPMRIEREEAPAAVDFSSTTLSEDELAAELAAVNAALAGLDAPSTGDSLLDELSDADAVSASTSVSPALVEVSDDIIFGAAPAGASPAGGASSDDSLRRYNETLVDDMDAVVAALDRELAGIEPEPATRAVESSASAQPADGSKTLAPVRRGQTLWSIASANRVGGVSVEQMMVALLRANPDAFEDGNINALNRGAILRVPSAAEVSEMDRQSALTSVNEQNALWKKYRDQARAKPAQAQPGENAEQAVAKPETEDTDSGSDATLTLVADTEKAGSGDEETVEATTAVSAETEAQLAELRNQLNLAQEEVESERLRAEELNSRLTELEAAVETANKVLDIRNNELLALQEAVKQGQGEADAEAARQLSEAQEQMAAELQAVKDQAQQQADEAAAQREQAQQKIAELQEQLAAGGGDGAGQVGDDETIAALKAQLEAADSAAAERLNEAQQKIAELQEQLDAAAAAGVNEVAVTPSTPEMPAAPVSNNGAAQPWYQPYLTADNAKIAGGVAVAGLGLWALLGFSRRRKEEQLFAEENYITPEQNDVVTAGYEPDEPAHDETDPTGDDATAYGHTQIADELGDATVDATDLTALDSTMAEDSAVGNVDILQEADVYLSYGLADRAEELLDGAIERDPNDSALQAKRLEALFVKQDGVSFETAAMTYHDKFGGAAAPHWDKIASWGAALAPGANLFKGVEPANLDETQDITSLDTTKLVGGAAAAAGAAAAGAGGLVDSLGDAAEENVGDAIDTAVDLQEQAEDAAGMTSVELEQALDSTTEEVSALGDDLSETAVDAVSEIEELSGEVADIGDLTGDLTGEQGVDLDELNASAATLGDDLESMSAGLEGDLEMTDLEATLAGDGELEELLEATSGDNFELGGTEAGDDGLAGEISMDDLESELMNTDATGSLGGLSEEVDFEAAGLSLGDETSAADLTVTGDEVDTMLDLARAYIDMGDGDSANSTINEIIATGNADQVAAAKELQAQLG